MDFYIKFFVIYNERFKSLYPNSLLESIKYV